MAVRAWRIVLAAALLALPYVIATSTPVQACSCGPSTAEDVVREANLIVVGRVTSLSVAEDPPVAQPLSHYDPPLEIVEIVRVEVRWSFAVDDYVLGSGDDVLMMRSFASASLFSDGSIEVFSGLGADCGFAPAVGDQYLFIVGQPDDNGVYSASGCSGGFIITPETEESVQAYIDELLAAQAPQNGPPPDQFPETGTGPPDENTPPWAAVGLGVAGATLGTGVLLFRRTAG